MSMLKNQIVGMYRQGASLAEISEALEVDEVLIKGALSAERGLAVKNAMAEEEDVTEEEAREMMGIVKSIARDEEAGVYARLNAAKYAHGAKRGYHKVNVDVTLGSDALFLRLNEAYQGASKRAREALLAQSIEAVEIKHAPPLENPVGSQLLDKLTIVQAAVQEPSALHACGAAPGP